MLRDDRYRRAAVAGGVGVWDWNLATNEIYVDPVLKQILGYQDHEIENHLDAWGRLVHPDDAAGVLERAQAHIAGTTPVFEVEHRMLHRDGSIRWFLARGCVTRDADGRAISVVGTDTDITARKHNEAALRRAEEINKRIVESTNDCVTILGLDGRVLYVNPEGLRLLELPDPFAEGGRPLLELLDPTSLPDAENALAAARSGRCGRFQGAFRSSSGVTRWWDVVITPITDPNDAVIQLLAVSRDVTERRREDVFRTVQHEALEMITTGTPLPDVLDRLVVVVEQLCDGMLCSVLLLDDDAVTIRHGSAPNLPHEYVRTIDGVRIGPNVGSCGTAMYLGKQVIVTDISSDPLWEGYRGLAERFGLRACWSMPIFSPQQRVLGSFAMYYTEPRAPRDHELQMITSAAYVARNAIEHHRALHALRESEQRNGAILRAIPDLMFVTTLEGAYLDYHAKDESELAVPPAQFLGRNIGEVLPGALAERFLEAYDRARASGQPEKVEYELAMNGEERLYDACIVHYDNDKVLSIVRDVTSRKRAEAEVAMQRLELAHLSRVAQLGELTGNLAHELSQPLTAVLSNAQAARHMLNREPIDANELRDALDDVIRNNRRAGAFIDRLRALMRKEQIEPQPLDLNDVVREVIDLAHSELISRRITPAFEPAPGIPLVLGDRLQLQQVVLNLLLNACEAMRNTPALEKRVAVTTAAHDGFVELALSDRGTGIPADQLDRVFEPFVTFRDDGLGLGLTISRSIVSTHGGSIRAENNPDGGATFRCFLPAAGTQALEQAI